jgi:hypothetical protein
VSPVGEESNVPSDEDDDEDSSEEYDGETEEESGKSTGDVDPDEVESKVSDEEEVHDGDEAITPSTPLRRPVSRDDYDTPIADLFGSNRSRLSKRKMKAKNHRSPMKPRRMIPMSYILTWYYPHPIVKNLP